MRVDAAAGVVGKPPTRGARWWLRQVHLWLGAWGALAAILYGLTGFVLNHRFNNGLPQGEIRELGVMQFAVPTDARNSVDSLRDWLRRELALTVQTTRVQSAMAANPDSGKPAQPERWSLGGGTAREGFALEYVPGNATAQLRRSAHSSLAGLLRLHKGVGGGLPWTLFADSVALGFAALGISGLLLWSRGRSLRQIVLSIAGLAAMLFATMLTLALA